MRLILITILSFSFNAFSASMTLYAINSPVSFNWTTPRTLLRSALLNFSGLKGQKSGAHRLGHAFLAYQCDGEEEVISGMTSSDGFNPKNELFTNKVGLNVLLMDNKGHLETTEEARESIENLTGTKRLNSLEIEITNSQCLKLKEWHALYASRAHYIYGGLDKKPLKGEGAGCTAYAMSFFEYADIDFDYFHHEMRRVIYIPKKLLGSKDNEVSVGEIYKDKTKLILESPASLKVDFYDPTDMYYWILNKSLEFTKTGKVSGLQNYNISLETNKYTKFLKLSKKP